MGNISDHIEPSSFLKLGDEFYSTTSPQPLSNPRLVSYSASAGKLIDLDKNPKMITDLVSICSGNLVPSRISYG